MPQLGRDVLRAQVYIEQSLQPRFPDVNVVDLQEAWRDILRRAKLIQHHKITPRGALGARAHEHGAEASCRAASSSSSKTCST
jgi:segregation and condensation protein A